MLECDYWSHLYDRIVYYLMRELEILMIKRDYQGKVKEHIDKNQRDYILREELKVIREELGDDSGTEDADGYMEQLEKLNADKETKEKIKKRSSVSRVCREEVRRRMFSVPISRRCLRCVEEGLKG